MGQLVSEMEVQFYDIAVSDWPGEYKFYRDMAFNVKNQGGSVLEVGCGTGRISLRLAQEGISIVGLDFPQPCWKLLVKKVMEFRMCAG